MDKEERRKSIVKAALRQANTDKKGILGNIWSKLKLCSEMVKDIKGSKYKNYPVVSILMIIFSIIYFFSPFDVIPDWILGFGFIDDATIAAFMFRQIAKDLEKYEKWKNDSRDNIL